MDFQGLLADAQLYLLVFARVLALLQTAPLVNSSSIPPAARVGLTLFLSFLVYPSLEGSYVIPDAGLAYVLMLVGEVLVGVLLGLMINLVHTAFIVAGEFFSVQTGFSASQVFDPMAQIQLPIMGQFLNLIAMFIFISVGGFRRLFISGIHRSFQAFSPADFAASQEHIFKLILSGFGNLFVQALLLALPIMGTLLLVSVSMGLLAKAAPQMNLLMLGFPINITVAFLVIFITLPFLAQAISQVIDHGFAFAESFFVTEATP